MLAALELAAMREQVFESLSSAHPRRTVLDTGKADSKGLERLVRQVLGLLVAQTSSIPDVGLILATIVFKG